MSASIFALVLGLAAAPVAAEGWPTVSRPALSSTEGAKDAALVVAIEDCFVAQDPPGRWRTGGTG